MTDNVENLILEHLKLLRNEVKAQGIKMDEQFESVRLRLSSIEGQMAGIHADIAIIHGRMDSFESRFDRIERRLELRDEPVLGVQPNSPEAYARSRPPCAAGSCLEGLYRRCCAKRVPVVSGSDLPAASIRRFVAMGAAALLDRPG